MELARLPGHLIRRMQQIAVAVFLSETKGAGAVNLTPVQYAALFTIAAHPDIDQTRLAGMIALDRTTTGGVVERLVQKGLVDSRQSTTDRRTRQLSITSAGRTQLDAMTPSVLRAQRVMLGGLDEAEARTFMDLLEKAIRPLSSLSRPPARPGCGGRQPADL
ncbi:MarR family winged helix-turn-helix transcriptional regulator [Pseudochelatococcus sp. B33]